MKSFYQLFKANLLLFTRNRSGIFWTLLMPVFLYVALSILPIGSAVQKSSHAYSNFVLPGIVAMTIMQGGIYGLAYWMTDLKAKGVIKRLLATPLKQWQLLISLVLSRLLITIFQSLILTLIGILFFNAEFTGNIFSTLFFILVGGAIFLFIGLLIANVASSYETAAPLTSAIGLPFTFLGNIFYPIDVLPNALKVVSKLLPITYIAGGLRKSYMEPFSWSGFGPDLLISLLWLIVVTILTIRVFRLKE